MKFFDDTLEDAVALMTGHKPRILALVQDCFEASLLLLQEQFPQFISPSPRAIRYFQDDQTKKNQHEKPELLNASSRASLREKAKVAAVKQFRTHLLSSSVNASIVEECSRNLDGKDQI
jgi:hypothetical protein